MYDLVIIGGGPAGVAAGVYAARKKIKVALVAESFGGQSLVSADVQNWIGTKSISGLDLGKALIEKKITQVVFDRSFYAYKGRVQKVAEGVREAGVVI